MAVPSTCGLAISMEEISGMNPRSPLFHPKKSNPRTDEFTQVFLPTEICLPRYLLSCSQRFDEKINPFSNSRMEDRGQPYSKKQLLGINKLTEILSASFLQKNYHPFPLNPGKKNIMGARFIDKIP